MNRTIIGFLQNAWSPVYAGGEWPRRSWLAALARSRSGKRLSWLEGKGYTIEYHNCTPLVGADAKSVLPPDIPHIVAVISSQPPDGLTLVTFGAIAEKAIGRAHEAFPFSMRPYEVCRWLALPHPAYRVVTNGLFQYASRLLADPNMMCARRVRLVQLRNRVTKQERLDL